MISANCTRPGLGGACSLQAKYSARAARVSADQRIVAGGSTPSSAAQNSGEVATMPSAG